MATERQFAWRVPGAESAEDKRFPAVPTATQVEGWRTAWAFADQAVVSIGNFLTNIILARKLAPHDFGVYAILLGAVLFVYSSHSALVTYPLSLRGATSSKDGLRSLTTFSLWLTASIGLLFGTALIIACLFLGKFTLGLCGGAAMFLLIIQETVRRALMSHMRFRDSFLGDSLSYLGQVALVLLLGFRGRLSPETAFLAMAATSLAATALQMMQLRIYSPRVSGISVLLADFWNLGRWMVLNNVTAIFSVQFFPWMLALLLGAAAAGTFQALSNVLGVTNPVVFSSVSLILPASARAWRESGLQAASRVGFRYGGLGGLILFPFFAVTMLVPGRVLAIFYGHGSSYVVYESALRILVLAMAANYVAVVISTVVNALEQSRMTFVVLVVSAVSSLFIGLPLMAWKGLAGAAIAMLIGAVIRASMMSVVVGRCKFNVVEA